MGTDEDMILDDRTARSYDLDDNLGGLSIIKPSSAEEEDEFAGLYGDTVKAPAPAEEEDDFDWESPVGGDSDDDDDFE
jgi:DNA-directed RNA polymerase subunit beta'